MVPADGGGGGVQEKRYGEDVLDEVAGKKRDEKTHKEEEGNRGGR